MQRVEGHWRQGGVLDRDNLVRLVVDVPERKEAARLREDKAPLETKLEQLESW